MVFFFNNAKKYQIIVRGFYLSLTLLNSYSN